VDGLWLDDVWYYGGGDDAVHVRTARARPQVAVHLPDPQRVVIVEGRVRPASPDPALARRLAGASRAKYPEYGAGAESFAGALALDPVRALAWTSYPADATRFVFPS
jgi:hypothetical protein